MNVSNVNMYFKKKHSKCPPPLSGFGRLPDMTVKHRMNLGCPQPNKHLTPKRSLLFFFFFFNRPCDPFDCFLFYFHVSANMHFLICGQGDAHCLFADAWVLFLTRRSGCCPLRFIPPGCCRTSLEEAGGLGFTRDVLRR